MLLNWGPQKGRAFKDLPKKTLAIFDNQPYLVSKKYDGNQIFIVKQGNRIRWFTSDWKEFNLPTIGVCMPDIVSDYVIVAEMNYDGEGKLGERTVVQGKITTERVNFKKGLKCTLDELKVQIKVFDYLQFDARGTVDNYTFKKRWAMLHLIAPLLPKIVTFVEHKLLTGLGAQQWSEELHSDGWEGVMCIEPDSYYYMNKRVNHVIKLKNRPTADLRCIDTELGEGKYSDCIGALVLEDSQGRRVKVGSGLSDQDRLYHEDYYIGKIIEIQYEQLMDTYQQPTFICIRDDKQESD